MGTFHYKDVARKMSSRTMEQSSVAPPALSSNQFLLLVAIFPVAVAALFTAIIHAAIPFNYERPAVAHSEYASIYQPHKGTVVSQDYLVSGEIAATQPNTWLYVAEENEGKYYPKAPLDNNTGSWQLTLYAGAAAGTGFRIVILRLTAETKSVVDKWFETGNSSGQYPGIESIGLDSEIAGVKLVSGQ